MRVTGYSSNYNLSRAVVATSGMEEVVKCWSAQARDKFGFFVAAQPAVLPDKEKEKSPSKKRSSSRGSKRRSGSRGSKRKEERRREDLAVGGRAGEKRREKSRERRAASPSTRRASPRRGVSPALSRRGNSPRRSPGRARSLAKERRGGSRGKDRNRKEDREKDLRMKSPPLILHPSDFVKIERFTYSKLQMCLVSCLVFGFQKHFELSIRNLVYQGHLI